MTNIFDNINARNKEKLLYSLEADKLNFKANTSILSLIKDDNIIGIILNGYLEIIRTDHNANRTIIEELYDGDIFGTMISSLNNNEYDIITKEETTIILLDYNRLINFSENSKSYYNEFIKNLLQIIISKVKEKNERIEILTKKTIRNKLLEYFNIEAKNHGSKYVYLPFNFIGLADYIGVDRCAMSREIKYLKEEGMIEVKGKRITLLYERQSIPYKNY